MSLGTSGSQAAEWTAHDLTCTQIVLDDHPIYGAAEFEYGCGWRGDADAWWDPELRRGGWTCPSCGKDHQIAPPA